MFSRHVLCIPVELFSVLMLIIVMMIRVRDREKGRGIPPSDYFIISALGILMLFSDMRVTRQSHKQEREHCHITIKLKRSVSLVLEHEGDNLCSASEALREIESLFPCMHAYINRKKEKQIKGATTRLVYAPFIEHSMHYASPWIVTRTKK